MSRLMQGAFHIEGPLTPLRPVLLSVPHAGRAYPLGTDRLIRPSPFRLMTLEDRAADLLVAHAVQQHATALVADAPRLWIDLNRHELDLDPALFSGPVKHNSQLSAKARGGLGLIPSRTASLGPIWSRKLTPDELRIRIESIHRPFHAQLEALLDSACRRFGETVLLDIHSMPTLPESAVNPQPKIVIGDLFGKSSAPRFSHLVAEIGRSRGYPVALNAPYAGNFILERHGQPKHCIHALQIEIDRSLYLDDQGANPKVEAQAIQMLIADCVNALEQEISARDNAIAAE